MLQRKTLAFEYSKCSYLLFLAACMFFQADDILLFLPVKLENKEFDWPWKIILLKIDLRDRFQRFSLQATGISMFKERIAFTSILRSCKTNQQIKEDNWK